MSRFNRFGATYSQVLAMFPGTVLADFDAGGTNGQANIEAVLDRITLDVADAINPQVYRQITQVDCEQVVRNAAQGQTTFNLGLAPVKSTMPYFLWRYPSLAGMQYGYTFGTWANTKPVPGFWGQIAAADFALSNATTGLVTLQGSLAAGLTLGERIYASYDVDTDNAAFSMPSVAAIVVYGTAAELGSRLYAQNTEEWKLVGEYRERYRGAGFRTESDGLLTKAFHGTWVPEELRKLNYWTEVERRSDEVGSNRLYRG